MLPQRYNPHASAGPPSEPSTAGGCVGDAPPPPPGAVCRTCWTRRTKRSTEARGRTRHGGRGREGDTVRSGRVAAPSGTSGPTPAHAPRRRPADCRAQRGGMRRSTGASPATPPARATRGPACGLGPAQRHEGPGTACIWRIDEGGEWGRRGTGRFVPQPGPKMFGGGQKAEGWRGGGGRF